MNRAPTFTVEGLMGGGWRNATLPGDPAPRNLSWARREAVQKLYACGAIGWRWPDFKRSISEEFSDERGGRDVSH